MPYKDPVAKKAYDKAYRERNKEKNAAYQKEYAKTHDLTDYKASWYKTNKFSKYGITREDFERMAKEQNESCAICQTPFKETFRTCIDHCHSGGQVRGLLCFHCNTGLGHFKDSKELLEKAIKYLND